MLWAAFLHVTVREADCVSIPENLAFSFVFKCFLELWKQLDEECLSLKSWSRERKGIS